MNHTKVQALLLRESIAQHSQLWFEVRKGLVTASEVGSILGTNKYKTRRQLLMQKIGCCSDEMSWFGQRATSWGNDNEDKAAKRFSEVYGKRLLHFGLFVHPEFSWIGASPDGVTSDGCLLEIKYVFFC